MTGITLQSSPVFAAGISRPVAPAVAAGATDEAARSTVRAAIRAAGSAVHDAVMAASRSAATITPVDPAVTDRVAASIATLNRALDTLEAGKLSADFQTSIRNAVREAVAAVSNGSDSGLTLARVDGRERPAIDTSALATALANDPQALDALVVGPTGLPEAFSAALTDEVLAAAAATASRDLIDEVRQVADIVRAAGRTLTLRSPRFLESFPAAASLSRLDLLV